MTDVKGDEPASDWPLFGLITLVGVLALGGVAHLARTAAIERSFSPATALVRRDRPGVSDSEYAELTYIPGQNLIASGKVNEGITLGIEATKNRPCEMAYSYLETLAGDAAIRGHKEVSLQTYRWLEKNSGSFGATERFLSNLAHTEEDSGNLPDAIRVLERLTESHPNSRELGEQLLRLSLIYYQVGDEEKSTAIRVRVRDGDFPEEIKARAKRSLELESNQGPVPTDVPASG